VTATIDTASVQTQNARRDKDLRSPKFLHTDRHPRMTFTGSPADGETLTGTLQVQDISQPVTLALSAEPAADGARFRATARIDRYAAGVTSGKGMVARYVDIELDIAAVAIPASH
jgi:polyisoprenoid-binding protein YceI